MLLHYVVKCIHTEFSYADAVSRVANWQVLPRYANSVKA